MLDLGPQHRGDDPFTARMRLHQSWYRAAVLQVPCGVGPHAKSKAAYGNMLREEDGARGLTFLTPEIAVYAAHRDPHRHVGRAFVVRDSRPRSVI